MNFKILLFAISAAAISSCSTAYKNTQTPDDVYYSPTRVVEENSKQQQVKEEPKKLDLEEREIRMSAYDRRWRDFDDDYDYRYDPYKYGYSYGYYYNPYYCHYPVFITNMVISNPKNTVPRMTNLGSYSNASYGVSNTKYGSCGYMSSQQPYNNSNTSRYIIRRILTSPADNNPTRSGNGTRSYTPSSGSSGSSSGSSGGSVSRSRRGG
jgi:hypothetical protein